MILNSCQENGTLSMINQMQIMMQEKKIIYKTEVIKSNLCDYNNTYILVRDDITIIGHNVTQAAFKNCTPFTKCITYTDGTTIDDAEDLDLVILMYNLLEYSSNYSDTCSSWFNSKDEAIDFADIANNDNVIRRHSYKWIKWSLKRHSNCCALSKF